MLEGRRVIDRHRITVAAALGGAHLCRGVFCASLCGLPPCLALFGFVSLGGRLDLGPAAL